MQNHSAKQVKLASKKFVYSKFQKKKKKLKNATHLFKIN